VRAPPFFRISAGHRVEGRNPWHLQCSRNQLRAGTQFRRLVRSLSLRPSWLLASWADQTEPRLSLPQASTSGLPALRSPRGLPDMTTAPNGELRRQDLHLQVQQLVSLRSLPWVPGTAVPHLPDHERTAPGLRYYAPLRLPVAHLGGVRCSLSFPDALGRASGFVSLACARLVCEADASLPRRESSPRWSALLCLIFPKETIGSPKFPSHPCESMPRSQTPVVSWTLALASPGLLPSGHCTPSAFPRHREDYPVDHDFTYFGAPSRGLLPRSLQLRTPITGGARGVHS
jgi:hypothetical protein